MRQFVPVTIPVTVFFRFRSTFDPEASDPPEPECRSHADCLLGEICEDDVCRSAPTMPEPGGGGGRWRICSREIDYACGRDEECIDDPRDDCDPSMVGGRWVCPGVCAPREMDP